MRKTDEYLVTGEKLLPGGNIERVRSCYPWNQFQQAQSMVARYLLDDGYLKMQIEVIKSDEK